jgi:hypothetical protein
VTDEHTEMETGLSPLTDPTNVDLRLVPDEPDEGAGMTPDEIDAFLQEPVEPAAPAE